MSKVRSLNEMRELVQIMLSQKYTLLENVYREQNFKLISEAMDLKDNVKDIENVVSRLID